MATKPLQSIKFPGLSDTYTVPQIDDTLTVEGRTADAKVTGTRIDGFESMFPYPVSVTYESGGISTSGGTTNNSTRIRTKGTALTLISDGDAVYCDSDYEITVGVWTAKNATQANFVKFINTYRNGWVHLDGYSGKYAGILIRKVGHTEEDISADIATLSTHVIYNRKSQYMSILRTDVNSNAENLAALGDALYLQKDFLYDFEIGNINGSTSPPSFSSLDSRVRSNRYGYIPLKAGDVITLSDFTGLTFCLGWKNSQGAWTSVAWRTKAYTVIEDGSYWILIRYSTEAEITDLIDIVKKVRIYKKIGINDDIVAELKKSRYRSGFVKSINHRGYTRVFPENTIIAYKGSAVRGFNAVETDVRYTSDGIPVLLHDESINRTARNADGTAISETVNIADITYEEALEYDFGIKKNANFAGTKIPTFQEFIELCRKLGLEAYIELKVSNVSTLVDIVKRCGMLRHVTWISFNSNLLSGVKNIDPKARLGMIAETYSDSLITTITQLKSDANEVFLNILYTAITDTNIETLIANDIPLEFYTINTPSAITGCNPYVTGITSDWYSANWTLYDNSVGIDI